MIYINENNLLSVSFPKVTTGTPATLELVHQTSKIALELDVTDDSTDDSIYIFDLRPIKTQLTNGQYDYYIYTESNDILASGIIQYGEYNTEPSAYEEDQTAGNGIMTYEMDGTYTPIPEATIEIRENGTYPTNGADNVRVAVSGGAAEAFFIDCETTLMEKGTYLDDVNYLDLVDAIEAGTPIVLRQNDYESYYYYDALEAQYDFSENTAYLTFLIPDYKWNTNSDTTGIQFTEISLQITNLNKCEVINVVTQYIDDLSTYYKKDPSINIGDKLQSISFYGPDRLTIDYDNVKMHKHDSSNNCFGTSILPGTIELSNNAGGNVKLYSYFDGTLTRPTGNIHWPDDGQLHLYTGHNDASLLACAHGVFLTSYDAANDDDRVAYLTHSGIEFVDPIDFYSAKLENKQLYIEDDTDNVMAKVTVKPTEITLSGKAGVITVKDASAANKVEIYDDNIKINNKAVVTVDDLSTYYKKVDNVSFTEDNYYGGVMNIDNGYNSLLAASSELVIKSNDSDGKVSISPGIIWVQNERGDNYLSAYNTSNKDLIYILPDRIEVRNNNIGQTAKTIIKRDEITIAGNKVVTEDQIASLVEAVLRQHNLIQ